VDCNFGTGPSSSSEACRVEVSQDKLGGCDIDNKFGFLDAKPCILVKLNKIYGWEPEPFGLDGNGNYDDTQLQRDLDEMINNFNMPADVPTAIRKTLSENAGNVRKLNLKELFGQIFKHVSQFTGKRSSQVRLDFMPRRKCW
jgi:hypothetical protein